MKKYLLIPILLFFSITVNAQDYYSIRHIREGCFPLTKKQKLALNKKPVSVLISWYTEKDDGFGEKIKSDFKKIEILGLEGEIIPLSSLTQVVYPVAITDKSGKSISPPIINTGIEGTLSINSKNNQQANAKLHLQKVVLAQRINSESPLTQKIEIEQNLDLNFNSPIDLTLEDGSKLTILVSKV